VGFVNSQRREGSVIYTTCLEGREEGGRGGFLNAGGVKGKGRESRFISGE